MDILLDFGVICGIIYDMEIIKYPNPILRKKAEEVREFTPEIKQFGIDLAETMLSSEPAGMGLAAPQVGISKRVIAVQTDSGPAVFINPKIVIKSKETEIAEEGCLSLPEVWLKIKRAKLVEIQYLDKEGKISEIKAEGVFARVIQHEVDHLNGVLIIDKVSLWQKLKRTLKRR